MKLVLETMQSWWPLVVRWRWCRWRCCRRTNDWTSSLIEMTKNSWICWSSTWKLPVYKNGGSQLRFVPTNLKSRFSRSKHIFCHSYFVPIFRVSKMVTSSVGPRVRRWPKTYGDESLRIDYVWSKSMPRNEKYVSQYVFPSSIKRL